MKTRNKILIFLISALAVAGVSYLAVDNSSFHVREITRVCPENVYPNESLTPGKADTLNLDDLTKLYDGKTYSESHRAVSEAVKKEVCQEYPENCKGTKEIDHFIPVALGGSNDITNLFPQPEINDCYGINYGFREKDRIEVYLINQVKSGKMSVKEADDCLLVDWVACLMKHLNYYDNNFGSAISNSFYDGEDEIE